MAFDLHGPTRLVQIEQEHEALFELPERYGEPAAFLPQLWQKFFQSSVIGAGAVGQFRGEVLRLLERRRNEIEPGVVKDRKVFAHDPTVREEILIGLLRQDPLYAKLEELVELCDECLRHGADIRCEGD